MCLCALAWCKIPRVVWASSINTIRASGIPQIDIPAKEAILRNTPYELGDTASDHHHKHHTPRHPAARRRRVRRRLGRRRPATGHHGAAPRHHRHRCHQYGRKTRTNVNNALNNYRVAHRSGDEARSDEATAGLLGALASAVISILNGLEMEARKNAIAVDTTTVTGGANEQAAEAWETATDSAGRPGQCWRRLGSDRREYPAMSGDIGVDAVDPANICAHRNW